MDENKKVSDEETPTPATVAKSVISIIVFGVLGWVCHLIFGWNTWWCIGIGLFIGWLLPGFLAGAKEQLKTLNDNKDDND